MFTVERQSHAGSAALWAYLSNLDRWAEMLPTVDEIERLDDRSAPVTIGSRFRVKQPGLATAEFEVTDWRPDSGFTWEAQGPGIRTRAVHTLRNRGNSTLLRLSIEFSGPLAGVLRILLRRKTNQYLALEADTFVQLAESGSSPRT